MSLHSGEVVIWDRETDTLRQIPGPEMSMRDGLAGGYMYTSSASLGGLSGSTGASASASGSSAPSAGSGLAEFFLTQKKRLKDDAKAWGN